VHNYCTIRYSRNAPRGSSARCPEQNSDSRRNKRKLSNYKQSTVNVTATSLGEATVIKSTYGGVRTPPITFSELLANAHTDIATFYPVNNDCVKVDKLILEIADYKNNLADMAAEKLSRKRSTSWEAYQYLRDRFHDGWLPDRARQQLRRIIKRIQVHTHQCREYGYAYEHS
jgi:hypothetical protein